MTSGKGLEVFAGSDEDEDWRVLRVALEAVVVFTTSVGEGEGAVLVEVATDTAGTVLGCVWLDVQAAESARTAIVAALVTMR